MSRATANLILGIVIGGCAIVVVGRVRKMKLNDDPEAIAKRISRRLKTLESRVGDHVAAQGLTG